MSKFVHQVKRFIRDRKGATAMEYALIAALIGVSCVVAFTVLGNGLETLFGSDADGLKGAVDGAGQEMTSG